MKVSCWLLLLVVLLSACSQTSAALPETLTPTAAASQIAPEPTAPAQDPALASIQASFSAGPHAGRYSCQTCHPTGSGGVGKGLTLRVESSGQTVFVSTPAELCLKCHPGQDYARLGGSGGQLAHPESGCTSCHNAHSTQASCTQSTCHSDLGKIIKALVKKPDNHPAGGDPNTYMCGGSTCHDLAKQAASEPVYHQPAHRSVPCYVCHDGSGSPVTLESGQSWVTINPSEGATFIPHRITREVDCSKCHAANNPWKLIEISSGE